MTRYKQTRRTERKPRSWAKKLLTYLIILVLAIVFVLLMVPRKGFKEKEAVLSERTPLVNFRIEPITANDSQRAEQKIDEALLYVWRALGIPPDKLQIKDRGSAEGLIDVKLKECSVKLPAVYPLALVNYQLHQVLHFIGAEISDASADDWGKELQLEAGFSGFVTHILKITKDRSLEPLKVKIALVINNPVYQEDLLSSYLNIGFPVNFSFLPDHPDSNKLASQILDMGSEIALAIPMECEDYPSRNLGNNAIFVNLPEVEICSRLQELVKTIPELKVITNFRDSRVLKHQHPTSVILDFLKREDFVFWESFPLKSDILDELARDMGQPILHTQVYLDLNDLEIETIESILLSSALEARNISEPIIWEGDFSQKNYEALRKSKNILESWGVEFVLLSQLNLTGQQE
ncbi:divergent polysaccharide deacetylase family protein [bacterium]|nr:divergent polysaccharide deacetylase family protein [bacterium]